MPYAEAAWARPKTERPRREMRSKEFLTRDRRSSHTSGRDVVAAGALEKETPSDSACFTTWRPHTVLGQGSKAEASPMTRRRVLEGLRACPDARLKTSM